MVEFQIVVRGQLGPRLVSTFEGVAVEPGDDTTTLRGTGPDQGRLHGLLAHLQDLGIDLVSVSTAQIGAAGRTGGGEGSR